MSQILSAHTFFSWSVSSVAPGDFTFHFWAGPQILPYAQYFGNLPKTLFASRQALETLIRRLTLNTVAFPNIHQMVGTVVGVTKDASNPGYLQQVRVRTKDGEMVIDAALVVGAYAIRRIFIFSRC